jgi:hypothetical protein
MGRHLKHVQSSYLFKEYEGKRSKKIMKVRKEIQEYPNKALEDAFTDKLKDDDCNVDKTFTIGL